MDNVAFRKMFSVLHNLNMWDLEKAGIISKGDEARWHRFNTDLTTFVLKLPSDRLANLARLVESQCVEAS